MLTRGLKSILAGAFVLTLAGCAVSPQQVVIEPATEAGFATAPGDDVGLTLSVQDRRDEAVLGTLGGVYGDSSTLSARNNLALDLQEEIAGKLQRAGYTLNPEVEALHMKVGLTRLDYIYVEKTLGSEVQVTAELAVRAERADGSYIERTFRSGSNQGRVTRPTASDNQEFLEEALNDSLTRLVNDDQLNRFMGQP